MKMKENPNNICFICPDCTKQRQSETREKLKAVPLRVGDIVKVAIGEGKTIEHVWFEVIKVEGELFCGILINIPIYKQKLEWNDLEWLEIKQIIERDTK